MTKHTPGPWDFTTNADGFGITSPLTEERNELVATVWAHSDRPDESMRANAALVAAAPELLDALRALHAFASRMVERHGMNGDDSMTDADHAAWQDSASLANIAIAKATND